MRYFFDTEFIEDGLTIDLISIGIVSEDGRELYLINKDADHSKADDWVKENVIAQLPPRPPETDMTVCLNKKDGIWCPHASFKALIESFVGEDDKPEFWSYYSSYDWVALCQCWGRMLDIPKHFPKYCRDLKQLIAYLGIPKLPKQLKDEHNALADAHWIKERYESLNSDAGLKLCLTEPYSPSGPYTISVVRTSTLAWTKSITELATYESEQTAQNTLHAIKSIIHAANPKEVHFK